MGHDLLHSLHTAIPIARTQLVASFDADFMM